MNEMPQVVPDDIYVMNFPRYANINQMAYGQNRSSTSRHTLFRPARKIDSYAVICIYTRMTILDPKINQ